MCRSSDPGAAGRRRPESRPQGSLGRSAPECSSPKARRTGPRPPLSRCGPRLETPGPLLLRDRPTSTAAPPAALSLWLSLCASGNGPKRHGSHLAQWALASRSRIPITSHPPVPLFYPKCGTQTLLLIATLEQRCKPSPISHSLLDPLAYYPNDRGFIQLLRVVWTGCSPALCRSSREEAVGASQTVFHVFLSELHLPLGRESVEPLLVASCIGAALLSTGHSFLELAGIFFCYPLLV